MGIRTTWGLAVLVLAAPAWVGATEARCSAFYSGGRALVDIELVDFFDSELLRLVRLGLQGRIRVELSLYHRRALWFGEELAVEVAEFVITYSTSAGEYILRNRELDNLDLLKLERFALRPDAVLEAGERYRVEVNATLQVVTAESLGQVAKWMAGDEQAPLARETFLSTLAGQLARRTRTRCDLQGLLEKSQSMHR